MLTGDLDPVVLALLGLTLLVGAAVQRLVGLGLGLVAAPVAMLLEPALMPDLLLWLAVALPAVTLFDEHEDIDWHGLGWSLGARVPGTVLGVGLVTYFSVDALGVVVSLVVLVSVLLTARAVVIPVNRGSLVSAGLVSGMIGTASSIGGPPMAILLQHRPARQIRTTLAVYFLVGAGLSLAGLGLGGALHPQAFWVALLLSPCLVAGLVLARLTRDVLPAERVRTAILVVCSASALVLLLRSLL